MVTISMHSGDCHYHLLCLIFSRLMLITACSRKHYEPLNRSQTSYSKRLIITVQYCARRYDGSNLETHTVVTIMTINVF